MKMQSTWRCKKRAWIFRFSGDEFVIVLRELFLLADKEGSWLGSGDSVAFRHFAYANRDQEIVLHWPTADTPEVMGLSH